MATHEASLGERATNFAWSGLAYLVGTLGRRLRHIELGAPPIRSEIALGERALWEEPPPQNVVEIPSAYPADQPDESITVLRPAA